MIRKLQDHRALDVTYFEELRAVIGEFKLDPATIKYEEVVQLSRFLEVVWLGVRWLNWSQSKEIPSKMEDIGKASMRIQASLIAALPTLSKTYSYNQEIKYIERHSFKLFELYTSPIKFSEKVLKASKKESKINPEVLGTLFASCSKKLTQQKHEFEDILCLPPQTQQKKCVDSKDTESGITSLLSVEQIKIMETLYKFAVNDLQFPLHWINHFTLSLDIACLSESPPWTSERSKAGWSSFNVCILVLEQYQFNKGFSQLKDNLVQTFITWSNKAIDVIVQYAKSSDSSKTDIIANTFNVYLFPIFIFFSYLSKGNEKITIEGTELATKATIELLNVPLNKLLTPTTAESVLSSLYFIFSFMSKQVSKQIDNANNSKTLFAPCQKWNYIEIGLKLFLYLVSGISEISLANPSPAPTEKKDSTSAKKKSVKTSTDKKPKKPLDLQGALDSLSEITSMIVKLIFTNKIEWSHWKYNGAS